MQKIIIHIMNKKWFKTDTFELETKLLTDIFKKDKIKSILFYKGTKIEDNEFENNLKENGIYIQNYTNRDDIIKTVLEINNENNILYVHTTIETTMNITNDLKEIINQTSPKNHKIFRDKFIQRDLLQKYNKNLGIKFIVGKLEELDYRNIKEKVGTPFILKPTTGVQSSGVVKINNKRDFANYRENYENFNKIFDDRGIDGETLIAEEFIDGNLYSIDYFVGQDGYIRSSEPIRERLGIDIDVDDYFVLSRVSTKDIENDFRYIDLEKFISDTVIAMGIKNSFIHHEFKINTKGELKTIEVNGRIGGGRHELMGKAYGINFFEYIYNKEKEFPYLKENVIGINIFATVEGKLLGFNDLLLNEIKNKDSVYEIIKQEGAIGKQIGLTKNGFARVGTIKLSNKNLDILNSDIHFIEKNYKKLLFIEEKSKYLVITKIIKIFKMTFGK